ncbi:cytochrome P450 [Hygrophoropsis aurantiaca]|uniref:Cytochrome P450 n=1 Tax=Hygrophoropsis aurantiaca TaxID=72124 RepID=A0ACB8A413_9AGAM|nr:cytochrome P450 [Hygrophoropsis aurantiaca]
MSWFTDVQILSLVFLVSLVLVGLIRRLVAKETLPLPPGPLRFPIVGNALSMDKAEPWNTYIAWGVKYGDIFSIRLFNQDVIVINSEEIAKDLLEKRSSNYSDRPFLPTLKPFGWDLNFAFTPYGNEWRLARRFFHQSFRAEAAPNFHPVQMRKAILMLHALLETPQNFVDHLTGFSASIVMSTTFDYDTKPRNDPALDILDKALLGLRYMSPEATVLLSAFPFLMRLPGWFPGAGVSRAAASSLKYVMESIEKPLQYVQKRIETGTGEPCLVSDLMKRKEYQDETRRDEVDRAIKQASWTAFVGGSETTSSVLMNFVLAMVLYPHVQERAYAEIKAAIGTSRLPNHNDRPFLPYIEAIVRESMRWLPIVPLGVAHAATNSDIYQGYHIPKGATVVANTWAMTRNEAIYAKASEFIPERFLDEKGQLLVADSPSYAFGFGRRICPGRYVAEGSVWACVALILTVFEISKAKDAHGDDIHFVPTFTVGLTRHPNTFPCSFTPRAGMNSDRLAQLIAESDPN